MSPTILDELVLDRAFDVRIDLGPPIDLGETVNGRRRVIPIIGGTVSGAMTGEVLAVGADFQVVRPDGVTELEARYVLSTSEGLVYVDNRGYRSASAEDLQRLLDGRPVDPTRVYFRTSPRFETAAPSLAWLARTHFVGSGERYPDHVHLAVYAVP